jgi:hypothetical protein
MGNDQSATQIANVAGPWIEAGCPGLERAHDDPHQYWVEIADIVNDQLGELIDRVRQLPAGALAGESISRQLADLASPLMWQVAVIAAAGTDRQAFLEIMGKLFDSAELTLQTGRPVVEIFRLISPRGQA